MTDCEWRAVCFREDWNKVEYSKTLSQEDKLRNSLAHIFNGTRHEAEGPGMEYSDEWITLLARSSMIDAAVTVTMRDDGFRVPAGLQEPLFDVLADTQDFSLDMIKAKDEVREGPGLLDVQPPYLLIAGAAFEAGNLPLLKEVITGTPPPPGATVLFSVLDYRDCNFGRKAQDSHNALGGQADDCCDLIVDLIKSRWAKPHWRMTEWAIHADSFESGKVLVDLLAQHNIGIEEFPLTQCMHLGNTDMLEYGLQLQASRPTTEQEQFNLLRSAASDPGGVKSLDILWNHGIRALNWRLEKVPLGVRGREDVWWDYTPLHGAVNNDAAEVVEWLLSHGAKAFRDQYDKDLFEIAQERGDEQVLAAFGRYPGFKNEDEWLEYMCGMPQRRPELARSCVVL